MTQMMRNLVKVLSQFKPSVQLPKDFFDSELNRYFVNSYIPTPEMLDIFMDIRDSLQPNADQRARLFSGTYGTGKSDLMLMIANYITRSADDPILAPFFERLYRLDHAKADAIYKARLDQAPFLLVLLQPRGASTFSSFLLNGLATSLKEKGLEHLLGKTYYQAALDLIDKWENELPDNLKRLEQAIVTDYNLTLNGLKKDLGGPNADTAMSVFQPVFEKVTGVPFNPGDVIQEPDEAIDDVVKQLVASGQYSGIFAIIDEFTQLLNKLGKSPDGADSKAIDKVAALATRSRQNQFHFSIVSLYPFTQIPTETEQARVVIESTGGRFSNTSLRSLNTEELIRGSIEKLKPIKPLFESVQGQYDDLLNLAMRLWGEAPPGQVKRDWLREIVIEGCFPLHPLTTFCLPKLNAQLAQNERTMFNFIWDQERGLGHFIQKASGEAKEGWLTLFTVDKLFDYFEANLEQKREDLYIAYKQSSLELSDAQVKSGLEGRLLRALIMLEVPEVRADSELLRHALGLTPAKMAEINDALSKLEDTGAAYLSQSGYYQLVKPGRANPKELRRLIDQQARTILPSPLETLDANDKPDDVEASAYNSKRGSSRKLTAHFVSLAGLSSPATLNKSLEKNDGLLWYVVSASESELEKARSKAKQKTREVEQLVVAVPRSPTNILARLKGKYALEALRITPDYQTAELTEMLIDTGLVGKGYVMAFQEALQWFKKPSNFNWYYDGNEITVTTTADLSNLASTLMNKVFYSTPRHKIPQHLTPGGRASATVNQAVKQILQAPFKLEAKKNSAVNRVLLKGAVELGLIRQVDSEAGFNTYDVKAPAGSAVWHLIDEELQRGTSWPDIAKRLLNPPYGLYLPIIQLFIAAFYRLNRDFFEVYEVTGMWERPIEVTSDVIKDMVAKPTKYQLRYHPLTEPQRKFLRGLSENVSNHKVYNYRGETASLRNLVAKYLREWAEQLPQIARQASIQELEEIFINVPPDILSVAVVLMEIAALPGVPETASALLDTLPSQLGLPADSSSWSNETLEAALSRLKTAAQQLNRFQTTFESYMAGQVGQYFGQAETIENDNQVLGTVQKWRRERAGVVNSADLSDIPNARDFLYILEGSPVNFRESFLNKLPTLWKLQHISEWKTLKERDEYLQRLKQVKADIETRAIELGLNSEQRDLVVKRLYTLFNRQVEDTTDNALSDALNAELRELNSQHRELIQALEQSGLPVKNTMDTLISNILEAQDPIEQLRAFLPAYPELANLKKYHATLTDFVKAGHSSTYPHTISLLKATNNVREWDTSLYELAFRHPLTSMQQIIDEQGVVEQWDSYYNHYQTLLKAYQSAYNNLHRQRSEIYRQLQGRLTRYGIPASNLSEYIVDTSDDWAENGLHYTGETADLVTLHRHLQAAEKIEEDALRPAYQQILSLVKAVKQAAPPLDESQFQPYLENIDRVIAEKTWVAQWDAFYTDYQKLLQVYQATYADLHRRRDETYRRIHDRVSQSGKVPAVVTERIAKADIIGDWTEDGLHYVGETADLITLYRHLQTAEKIEEDALRPVYQQILSLVKAVKQAVPPLDESQFQPHLESVDRVITEKTWVAQWDAFYTDYQKLLQVYQITYADLHRRRDETYRQIRARVSQFGKAPAVVTERIAKADIIGDWTEDGLHYVGETADLITLHQHLQIAGKIEEDILDRFKAEEKVTALMQVIEDINRLPVDDKNECQAELEDLFRTVSELNVIGRPDIYFNNYRLLLSSYQESYKCLHRRRTEIYRKIRDKVAQLGEASDHITNLIIESDDRGWNETGVHFVGETATLTDLYHQIQSAPEIEQETLGKITEQQSIQEQISSRIKGILDTLPTRTKRIALLKQLIEEYNSQ